MLTSREVYRTKKKDHSWDLFFIIGAPLLAMCFVSWVSRPRYQGERFLFDPQTPEWFILLSALMTHFHVLLVFVRSHMNKDVFSKYKFRFIGIPILGLFAFWLSPLFASFMFVVAIYWDEWHTQMQTFGFVRIFDSKLGNNPYVGRRLDMVMIFVLGLFPHLILLTYIPDNVRAKALISNLALSPSFAKNYGDWILYLRYPLIFFAIGFSLFYVFQYVKFIKAGYKISKKKMALMAATGGSAIFIASFYSIADSIHYFNFYHSLQYIYFVFFSETSKVALRFNSSRVITTGVVIFVILFGLSILREMTTIGFFVNVWVMSSLLHFWYDGFIWSVRRQEV